MKRETVFSGYFTVERFHLDDGLVRDVIHASDGVSLLVYHRSKDRILLIRQVRESQIRQGNPGGFWIEAIAGRFDKDLNVRELAALEAHEEARVTVLPERIELVNFGVPLSSTPGITSERLTLAYVEVGDNDFEQTEDEFGVDPGERTRRIWIDVRDLKDYRCHDLKTFALIQWYLRKRLEERFAHELREPIETAALGEKEA